jgi:hypothetical protein
MNFFTNSLRTENIDKLEKELHAEKYAKKSALKEAEKGGHGANLPKLARDAANEAEQKQAAAPKKQISRSDVKAYHKALDAAGAKKTEKQKIALIKKVQRYYKLDKKCLSSPPDPNQCDKQLLEAHAYFDARGGPVAVQATFTTIVDILERVAVNAGVLETLALEPGFSVELRDSLARDSTLYDPELQEMLIELGGLESPWYMRLGSKVYTHWQQYSASVRSSKQSA